MGKMPKYILARSRALSTQMLGLIMDVFGLRADTDRATLTNIRIWAKKVSEQFYHGVSMQLKDVGFQSWSKVRAAAGLKIKEADFLEAWWHEIRALSSKDLTEAGMIQKTMMKRLGTGWKKFYEEFDLYSKTNLGMSGYDIKKKFLETTGKQFVSFVDKGGREWDAASYAEMWARTRSAEIADVVVRDEMEVLDMDVVQVSNVNDTCETCMLYDGKYYSLTGETEGLPVLDVRFPLHPNCLHDVLPVNDDSDKIDRYIKVNKKRDARIEQSSKNWSDEAKSRVDRQLDWNKKHRS
jgi:hypothetical protein